MAPKLSKLAKQYRKALDEVAEATRAAEQARAAWLEEAAGQRGALLAELAEFGTASGLDVDASPGRLVLAWRGRSLAVTEGRDGDTLDTDAGTRLVLAPEGEWSAETGSAREPLLDRGLRKLLVDALGVPDPSGEFSQPPPARREAAPAVTPSLPPPVEPEEPQVTIGYTPPAGDGRGPGSGDLGHLGRSGTRGFKRSKDVPPGSVVKDLKGPGPV